MPGPKPPKTVSTSEVQNAGVPLQLLEVIDPLGCCCHGGCWWDCFVFLLGGGGGWWQLTFKPTVDGSPGKKRSTGLHPGERGTR